ncbi:MAG: hypothetical protein MUO77_15215, partial [Anaerolineales bacterium]|nr:hypothetical protein [Anaerolineales bacterium]
ARPFLVLFAEWLAARSANPMKPPLYQLLNNHTIDGGLQPCYHPDRIFGFSLYRTSGNLMSLRAAVLALWRRGNRLFS